MYDGSFMKKMINFEKKYFLLFSFDDCGKSAVTVLQWYYFLIES